MCLFPLFPRNKINFHCNYVPCNFLSKYLTGKIRFIPLNKDCVLFLPLENSFATISNKVDFPESNLHNKIVPCRSLLIKHMCFSLLSDLFCVISAPDISYNKVFCIYSMKTVNLLPMLSQAHSVVQESLLEFKAKPLVPFPRLKITSQSH